MIQLQYSVDFTYYGACWNRYFKGVGSTQTSIFSPNTVCVSLFALQLGITAPSLFPSVFFDLCPAVPTQVGTLTQVVTSVHLGRPT